MLQFAFALDERDPNAMPVTRDLSPAKRAAILKWLGRARRRKARRPPVGRGRRRNSRRDGAGGARQAGRQDRGRRPAAGPAHGGVIVIRLRRAMVAGLEGDTPAVQPVRDALQLAIELEQPRSPYLYTMLSLDPSKNAAIVQLIDSVVVDEMLHMVLSANVLNAIGGSPEIDKPDVRAAVPRTLARLRRVRSHGAPAAVLDGAPRRADRHRAAGGSPDLPPAAVAGGEDHVTIGEFYDTIRGALDVLLGDSAFDASGRNQVPPDLMDGSIVVTNVATATAAIDTIVRQGEGTTTSPLDAASGEMAHYYRFEEIKHGHLLVALPDPKTPDTAYSYTGAAVPFDDTGVYPVPCDPRAHGFPNGYLPGSAQAQMNDAFNSTYTGLLGVLHALVNGDATNARFSAALGIMMSLKSQATGMAAGLARPGLHVGPTFQYQPTNP